MESLNPKGDKNTHASGNAKKVAVALKVVNISACVLGAGVQKSKTESATAFLSR